MEKDIKDNFDLYVPIINKIKDLLANGCVVVAIEGGSASGKTTLSMLLEEIFDCTVFHMDDFFLRPEQRTIERLMEVGGNIDRERFIEEVLSNLKNNEVVSYRKFDCITMSLSNFQTVKIKKLVIVEGVYSMHPDFKKYYDLSVFLDIPSYLQKDRINQRNSQQLAKRFFSEWIPLENLYFEKMGIKNNCDLKVNII